MINTDFWQKRKWNIQTQMQHFSTPETRIFYDHPGTFYLRMRTKNNFQLATAVAPAIFEWMARTRILFNKFADSTRQ